jgi:hypothetical protein
MPDESLEYMNPLLKVMTGFQRGLFYGGNAHSGCREGETATRNSTVCLLMIVATMTYKKPQLLDFGVVTFI